MFDQFILDFRAHAWLACALTLAVAIAGFAAQGKLLPFLVRFSPWTRTLLLLAVACVGTIAGSITAGATWETAIPRGIGPLFAALFAHYFAAPQPPSSGTGTGTGDAPKAPEAPPPSPKVAAYYELQRKREDAAVSARIQRGAMFVAGMLGIGVLLGLLASASGCTPAGKATAWSVVRDATGAVCPIVVQAAAPELAPFPICTTAEEIERVIQSLVGAGRARAELTQDELYHAIIAARAKAAK
jgi:hypothetical protein